MNALSWLLSTCPDASIRDGHKALRLAVTICGKTSRKNPTYLSTLAAAEAETGRFSGAVVTLERAIELAEASGGTDALRAENWKALVRLYKARRPYRQPTTR
ncbi:MAG: hypothetical protein JXQ73_07100 [Phycisphaerae bacterium]|nr:hypothetical protein [Phycisphaerae bacterium]